MSGPWQKYATTVEPALPREIIGPPDTFKAEDQSFQREANERARRAEARTANKPTFIPQGATQMMDANGNIIPIPTAPGDSKEAISNAIKGLGVDELLTSVQRAKKNLGSWWSTGVPGAIAGNVPGSARNNLLGNLESLKGALIMEKLQALKDASKTGASGMGAMSEREGDRLAAAVAALSPDMSQDELETSLNLVEQHARTLKDIAEGRMPQEGGQGLTDEQAQAELRKRIAASKTPADAAATIKWLIASGRDPDEDTIARIMANVGNPNPDVRPPDNSPGFGEQVLDATGNIIAGGIQGLAALPDMAAKTAGQLMSLPVEALGFEDTAHQLAQPFQIGQMVERAAPTPAGTMGQVNRFGGQLVGGALGFPARAANALTSRIVGGTAPAPNAFAPIAGTDVMRAADELSASTGARVQPMAADVAGPTIRRLTAVGAQLPLSARPIVNAGQRVTEQGRTARNIVASRVGTAADPVDAGEATARGLQTYRVRTSQQARTLYQSAEAAAEGAPVQPKRVLEKLGDFIRSEAEIPGGSDVLPVLEKLATDLSTAGQFSINGVRGMRTVLQGRLTTAGLTPTNAQRIVNELVDAAGDDIATSLTAAGKQEAAKAYRAADKFWAERMDVVNNAIKPIIGRNGEKGGEDVFKGLMQAAKGNTARLSQIMRVLPEEDAATIRATVIEHLGRSAPGNQGTQGASFSLNEFLTHWNGLSNRARSILFDQQTKRDLTNLATVAEGSKQASRYANASNTGSILGGTATVFSATTDLMTLAATTLSQIGGGMLLAAPGFARWMAKAPRNPRAMKSHIARLTAIAEANPTMADEISAFQAALLKPANSNAMLPAAASDGNQVQQ